MKSENIFQLPQRFSRSHAKEMQQTWDTLSPLAMAQMWPVLLSITKEVQGNTQLGISLFLCSSSLQKHLGTGHLWSLLLSTQDFTRTGKCIPNLREMEEWFSEENWLKIWVLCRIGMQKTGHFSLEEMQFSCKNNWVTTTPCYLADAHHVNMYWCCVCHHALANVVKFCPGQRWAILSTPHP